MIVRDGGSIIWAMKQHGLHIETPTQSYSTAEDNLILMYIEFGMAQKYIDDLQDDPLMRQRLGINSGLLPHMLYGGIADIAKALENNWSTVSGRGSTFELNMAKLSAYENEVGIPGFAMVAPSPEQSAVFSENSDLFLYIDEMTQKFIIGTESLDRWEEFLANCNKLGIDDVLEVIQERYDAYVRIVGK